MRFLTALFLLLLVQPAWATPNRQEFRGLIHTNDRPAVIAALKEVIAEDVADPDHFWHARDLFSAFTDLHPGMEAFINAWLADSPDDPLAQTAAGLYLNQQSWAIHGNGYVGQTMPDKMFRFDELQDRALRLLVLAHTAMPDLLPASDGLLEVATIRSNKDLVLHTLDTVMRHQPNRQSLRLAMHGFAPQWGGTQWQVDRLCARYAPMIKADPPYDAETCTIDMAYSTGYDSGPRWEAAHEALKRNHHPWLDYARLSEALAGNLTFDQRRAILEKAHADHPLNPDEAMAWDTLQNDLKGGAGEFDPVEYRRAVRRKVSDLMMAADNAPLDPDTIGNLVEALRTDSTVNGSHYPMAMILQREKAVLMAYPEDAPTWQRIASDILQQGLLSGDGPLDVIADAEPFLDNAIAYSLHDEAFLREAVRPKLTWLMSIDNALGETPDPALVPPLMRKRIEEVVICPALRQMHLLNAICVASGTPAEVCGGDGSQSDDVMKKLYVWSQSCKAILESQSLQDLAYTPVPLLEPIR